MHTYKDDGRSRQVKQIWPIYTENLPLEGPCIIFCNIYTFQRDTQCSSTDGLLMLRCQLYMFRTVTVHPQELLFRCCMCRLWYVVRTALSDTSRWYQRDVSDSAATLCISLECIYILQKMIHGHSNVKYELLFTRSIRLINTGTQKL